jgi:excisionase family DNA binding protein
MRNEVPIADKALLTLEEAADYFNIGMNKLRELTCDDHCPFVLWNGSKRLIKREPFKEYLYKQYSI